MRRTALALLLALGLAPAGRARAAQYRFSVPEAEVTVTIEKDGSALIHYKLHFRCSPGAHPIDVVDIGMPSSKFQAISASIDGSSIPRSAIRISTWPTLKGNGYEIHLGSSTIPPGGEGVFEFTGRSYGMVYQDTTDPKQASFRFGTTWFGERFVAGETLLTVRYRLPIPAGDLPEVADRILYHKKHEAKWAKDVFEGEKVVSVGWGRKVRFTRQHTFSVSFPKKYVDKVVRKTIWGLFYDDWWKKSPRAQLFSALIIIVAFGLIFFLTTAGTGWSVFIILVLVLGGLMYKSPGFHLLLYPIMAGLGVLAWIFRSKKRERYFPAELCREGGGIKRGLTAVEAAVLLEVPLHKILTMIIFALAKKGVLVIKGQSPLRLEVAGSEKSPGVWKLPDSKIIKLWPYEPGFIKAFQAQHFRPVEEMKLSKAFDQLVKQVVGHMDGFNLEETRDYYRYVVSRAWRQLKAEADYEARFKKADRALDWLMLDGDWDRGMRDLGGGGYHYHPWWWYGRPYGTYTWGGGGGAAFDGGGAGSAPELSSPGTSFSDVANSLTGRLETASSDLAGSLDSLSTTSGGGLDLSGFDKFTSETLQAMAESGGGSGGGGFGGCACAGCACACACAGGGR